MKTKYIVHDRQSLFDIAIQQCGSTDAAFELAFLNNKSVADDLTTGEELILPAQTQQLVAAHFTDNRLTPATALGMEETGFEGINYMGIEFDFIVAQGVVS
ncbi:MAG: hypothetical protein LBR52_04705 [Prevotellaceae bacterium]|jgi:hypothetical protein|nr:hypothetical protein [Prevotellaceae bacterium]